MTTDVQEYLGQRRILLDKAFRETLSGLLQGVPLRDTAFLFDALAGGKKLRGCLACLICEALGGPLEAVIPRAVAVELIQAATLIHDDFVDQDRIRRNRPAVWTLAGARRAVLLGDVIFASAIKMMSELGRNDGLIVSRTIAEVSQGALHEPLDPAELAQAIISGRINGNLYETIIYLKTAVLFGTACRLGAMAAEADASLAETAYRYGLSLGEAYQIADDLQEVKGYLASRSVPPDRLAVLGPAFLRFVGAPGPFILATLQGECPDWDEAASQCFRAAAEHMEEEITRRLRSAQAEMEENFPANRYSQLIDQTPGEIIRMFNQS